MIGQRHCPFCKAPAASACDHLVLACEARVFVNRCIELCKGERPWEAVCRARLRHSGWTGAPASHREDFMWLESAFCNEFLKGLRWFGGMDYEWRSGPNLEAGGFWVLLWSRNPQRLWWELRDELERQSAISYSTPASAALELLNQNFLFVPPQPEQPRFKL